MSTVNGTTLVGQGHVQAGAMLRRPDRTEEVERYDGAVPEITAFAPPSIVQ